MPSPDDLAGALAPPPTSDADAYGAQLQISAAAQLLGEQLLARVPEGRHRTAALTHLARATHVGYLGMRPALVPAGPDDEPIPYALAGPAEQEHGADTVPEVPGVHVWRWGIQTCRTLHPHARLIALILADCCGPAGYIMPGAQPTLRQLGDRAGLALHAVHQALQDLVTQSWLSRQQITHGSTTQTRYQPTLPPTRKGRD